MSFDSVAYSGRPTGAPAAATTAADNFISNDPDLVTNEPTANNKPEDVYDGMAEKPVLTNKPVKCTTNEVKTETTVNGRVA